jgi:Ni/Co efflux regulator RcnB
MAGKQYLPSIALAALFTLSGYVTAAEEPTVSLDRPGAGVRELKEGDNVPDAYQRGDLALQDWKKRNLSAPGEHEQWVEIQDKYLLVSIPTGTIREMIKKSDVKR